MMIRYLFVALVLILASGCVKKQEKGTKDSITVSILPQKYFIEQMVGNRYVVNVVLKDGANHESYEPTMHQVQELEKSGLYLMLHGNAFDKVWADRLKERNPQMQVVDLSKDIDLIASGECSGHDGDSDAHEAHSSGTDPHIWVSPSTAKVMIANIRDALNEFFPADSLLISEGYNKLKTRLDSMDLHYKRSLAPFAGKTFMVYHPATSYLARDYGLKELAIETEGKEPSVASLKDLIEEGRSSQVNLILMQQEFDNRQVAIAAQETGATVVLFNPMAYDWFEESEKLLNAFTTHLVRQ